MKRLCSFLLLLFAVSVPYVTAKDVYVRGYYRSDGTYVRPHVRSAPDGRRSNNYGRSQSNSQLMNPYSRDYDRDGTPNYLDLDDNNDGWGDDYSRW